MNPCSTSYGGSLPCRARASLPACARLPRCPHAPQQRQRGLRARASTGDALGQAQVVTEPSTSKQASGSSVASVDDGQAGEGASTGSQGSASSSSPPPPSTSAKRFSAASPFAFPALARKLLTQSCATDAAELLLGDANWTAACEAAGLTVSAPPSNAAAASNNSPGFTYVTISEEVCRQLLLAAVEKGNIPLALSLHSEMEAVRGAGGSVAGVGGTVLARSAHIGGQERGLVWPAASIRTTSALVLGLCQQLRTAEAIALILAVQKQGLPRNEDVGFGKVITVPLQPDRPLAVVQPQEGSKIAADAYTRYEFELFTGDVTSATSQALTTSNGFLLAALRFVGLSRTLPAAATHEFVLRAPDGTSRTFRAATSTSEVPGQVGERVTVTCAPTRNLPRRKASWLPPNPPGTSPGQPLAATNHRTGAVVPLLKPPPAVADSALPGWVVPVALLLASSDAASGLIDPTLPALAAGGLLLAAGSAVAGNTLVLPRMRQLPVDAVQVEYIRQRLLSQYTSLSDKLSAVLLEAADDVRVLARLWQLQNKMTISGGAGSGGGAGGTYEARIERVSAARGTVEGRLEGRLALVDGYSRVMNIIEIEVELDSEVPAAELAGIEQQIDRLVELEVLQDDWRLQAEAGDEVEKLLRAKTF